MYHGAGGCLAGACLFGRAACLAGRAESASHASQCSQHISQPTAKHTVTVVSNGRLVVAFLKGELKLNIDGKRYQIGRYNYFGQVINSFRK